MANNMDSDQTAPNSDQFMVLASLINSSLKYT